MSFQHSAELWAWVESFITRGQRISERAELRAQQFRQLCEKLGSPQQQFRSVHVAGSKGKGQTASFVACGLAAHRLRVGLYSSPHIHSYSERIQVFERRDAARANEAAEAAVSNAVKSGHTPFAPVNALADTLASVGDLDFQPLQVSVLPAAGWSLLSLDIEDILLQQGSSLRQELRAFRWAKEWDASSPNLTEQWCQPNFFAILTLLAFRSFAALKCDWVVLETGIGGRLCPTNAVNPELSVIAPIELEHTDVLGYSLEQITAEKAGIIKPGRPCVAARQYPEVQGVLQEVSRQRDSPLFLLEDCLAGQLEIPQRESSPEGPLPLSLRSVFAQPRSYRFHFQLRESSKPDSDKNRNWTDELHLRACSSTQLDNLALALLALRVLLHQQSVEPALAPAFADSVWADILSDLEQNRVPGRFACYWLEQQQSVAIFDGAHTPVSCRRLVEDLEHYLALAPLGDRKISLLFGAVQGKNFAEMAQVLAGHFDEIVLTRAGTFKENDLPALELAFRNALIQHENSDKNRCASLLLEGNPVSALQGIVQRGADVILVCGSFYLLGELLPR